MNYISDVMYFSDILPQKSINGVQDIVSNFSPLTNGQDDFLNGSVVELVIPMNDGARQIVYNSSGGKFNAGKISLQKYDLSHPTNTKFLLEWAGNGGYYLWPMNGDKTIQLFMDVDDGSINGSNNGQGIPGKYELGQRIYKLSNIIAKDGNLYVNLSVASKFGNFSIGVDGNNNVKGGNGLSPVNIWFKFITLGTKAWEIMIKNDVSVSSRCCFSNNIMTAYDNFTTACNNSGFTTGSKNCNGVVPKACSSFIKDGFDDPMCKDWCVANPKECYSSIKEWCNDSTKNNLNKEVCNCFNDGKFQSFQKEFTKNCKAPCKISDFTAGCFFPPCLKSGMNKVANQGSDCPSNTSIYQTCIQNLTSQMGGNVSADKIIALCQLNAGEVDINNPTGGSGTDGDTGSGSGTSSGTGSGTSSGNVLQPTLTPTIQPQQQPPAQDNSITSFWNQYKIYIIVGIVVLVLLIIVAIFVGMKK